jgi:hypothetical protein
MGIKALAIVFRFVVIEVFVLVPAGVRVNNRRIHLPPKRNPAISIDVYGSRKIYKMGINYNVITKEMDNIEVATISSLKIFSFQSARGLS